MCVCAAIFAKFSVCLGLEAVSLRFPWPCEAEPIGGNSGSKTPAMTCRCAFVCERVGGPLALSGLVDTD